MQLSEVTDSINTYVLYGYKKAALQWFLHPNLAHNKLYKYSARIPWTNTAFWVAPSWFKPVWIVSSYQVQTGNNQHNDEDDDDDSDDDDDDDNNNNNNNNVKTKVMVVITGAPGTVWKSLAKYLRNIVGKHDVKELQNTAILCTAHTLRKVLMWKYKTYLTCGITFHVTQIANTEQLQHYTPQKDGLFQVYNCNYRAWRWY